LLQIVFQERRNNGWFDMEAIETAMRSAMHQAGASALAQLLRYDPPDADHWTIPCPCGHSAHYKELRSKTMLTVLGPVELRRQKPVLPAIQLRLRQPDWLRPKSTEQRDESGEQPTRMLQELPPSWIPLAKLLRRLISQ
jgi:hypothetical protein